jgi:hypothetical protein
MENLLDEGNADLCPFLVSEPERESAQTLRERMERDGYLFFRGLISVSQIRATREEILKACSRGGRRPARGCCASGRFRSPASASNRREDKGD